MRLFLWFSNNLVWWYFLVHYLTSLGTFSKKIFRFKSMSLIRKDSRNKYLSCSATVIFFMMILWDHFAGFISKRELKIETRGASIYKTTLRDVFFFVAWIDKTRQGTITGFLLEDEEFLCDFIDYIFCIRLELDGLTVFENHRKSRIQHCEPSELRLHTFWVDKGLSKMQKMVNFGEFLKIFNDLL